MDVARLYLPAIILHEWEGRNSLKSMPDGHRRRLHHSGLVGRYVSSHYLLLALLFFAGLEMISVFHQWVLTWLVGLILILSYGIVLIRVEERQSFSWRQTLLPLFAATGLAGLVLFLPRTPLMHLYYVLAALIFFLTLKHGAKQAYPTWNWTLSVIVLFLNTAVITGLHDQLYSVPVAVVSAVVFSLGALLSFQGWRKLTPGWATATLLSLVLGLALSELSWVLNFLPVHFYIKAGVVTCAFYVLFNVTCLSQEKRLHVRDIVEYGVVSMVAVLILISSTDWT